ncbi:hypothetical protein X798_03017 [Onchocerca flexuosa]|uniref:C3H1-type domain-containing protein n=2 Tax=Onchocerca flexuosa TaxID=387005 RepID=A0A183H265_9BILA|nr:hypothetical protein X798_03017 [Onchocerca flexuosa]VDO30040.1 unnamed protein product [Onchocerca flexuosa]
MAVKDRSLEYGMSKITICYSTPALSTNIKVKRYIPAQWPLASNDAAFDDLGNFSCQRWKKGGATLNRNNQCPFTHSTDLPQKSILIVCHSVSECSLLARKYCYWRESSACNVVECGDSWPPSDDSVWINFA